MISQLTSLIKRAYCSHVEERHSKLAADYDRRNVSSYLSDSLKLSQDEKEAIKEKWGGIINCIPRGYDFFRGIKALSAFNPDYLPSSYYYPYIEGILNPEKWKHQLSHKSMIQLAYGLGINHPHTILRTYGGVFLNDNYKPLTISEALSVIKSCNSPLIYKPATDSEQGSGISLIKENDFDKLCKNIKTGQIFADNADFVLQIPVSQSTETAKFNPSSLNCMRITTINVNDKVSVGSRALKCGPKDSVVDNIGSGKRGVIVGVNTDGTLSENGFYGNGESVNHHNGVIFSEQKIGSFSRVLDAAIQLHRYTPMCKIIGWDIALNSDNEPILIEGNVIYPGISLEQMCSGPIFGNRTDEVVTYIRTSLQP